MTPEIEFNFNKITTLVVEVAEYKLMDRQKGCYFMWGASTVNQSSSITADMRKSIQLPRLKFLALNVSTKVRDSRHLFNIC